MHHLIYLSFIGTLIAKESNKLQLEYFGNFKQKLIFNYKCVKFARKMRQNKPIRLINTKKVRSPLKNKFQCRNFNELTKWNFNNHLIVI
jgi:hypothetical protein